MLQFEASCLFINDKINNGGLVIYVNRVTQQQILGAKLLEYGKYQSSYSLPYVIHTFGGLCRDFHWDMSRVVASELICKFKKKIMSCLC